MELTKDTRDRIFTAADSLHEQAGRAAFPTVDAVRKTAKVNMNDASAGMKEWRRAQTAQAAPAAVQVPATVQQASSTALAALWREAQELANESLRAAQAGWDAERIEAETLNKQMADAYEAQAVELQTAQERITELEATGRQAAEDAEVMRQQIEEARNALLAVQQRAAVAEQRAADIEHRATDLRTELDHAHQEAAQGRAELAGVREAHAGEIEALRAKAEAAADVLRTERDQARKDASTAREDSAKLRGQVEAMQAMQTQTAELMRALSDRQDSQDNSKPAAKPTKGKTTE